MQIATWNVNSLKVRLPQVLQWLASSACDVLALQELKLDNPANEALIEEFKASGYHYIYNGQKTYNGVALISKFPLTEVVYDIPGYEDAQKRVITATINGIRVMCAYFVNGEALDSSKFVYKLEWLDALHNYVKNQLQPYPQLVLLGDFNIAPENRDTYDSVLWEGKILCSKEEREKFQQLLELGLVDSFRHFNQEDKQFTWWDYRNFAFSRKQGLRIDHILVTPAVIRQASQCTIDLEPRRWERPSDHTPVVLSLNLL